MKKFYAFLPFFFFSFLALGQSDFELELQNRFWESTDEKQNTTAIPEKWKDESAVILYLEQGFSYRFRTVGAKKIFFPSFYHERVALLDKAAVEEYSQFTYGKNERSGGLFGNKNQDKTILGIKIIKPDGTEKILDIDREKVFQDDRVKVAVPGLEIGDILDIFVYHDDFIKTEYGYKSFEPVEMVLTANYPIKYRKLSIKIRRYLFFLNMESYNGAPKIKEVPTDKKRTRKYVIEAKDLEKSEFPRWSHPLVELPALKFQVVYSLAKRSSEAFLADDYQAVRKTNVNKEEIFDFYANNSEPFSKSSLREVLKYLDEKENLSKREQMLAALYHVRHKNYNQFIPIYLSNQNGILGYDEPCEEYGLVDGYDLVKFMARLALEKEVDYDILLGTADYNGSIDSLLLQSNLRMGLRMNFAKPLYFFQLSPHAQPNLPPHLEGTKAHVFEVEKDGWGLSEKQKSEVFPVSSAPENKLKEIVNIDFEKGFEVLKIDRKKEFSGHFKPEVMNRNLFLGDFLEKESTKYNTRPFYHCNRRMDNDDERVMKKMDALMLSLKEKHEKNLKKKVSENYDVDVDDYSHSVVNAARYSKEAFAIADNFTIKNQFIQKAGPNYLFEVGKLIGGQVQIEKKEMERKMDIDIDYAKTYVYQVEVKIPEGYKVMGLDNLQINVANPTGSFVSTASVENGVLKYKTVKTYAKPHYEAEAWEQMLPWLEAAYDFSQEKVMFKKI